MHSTTTWFSLPTKHYNPKLCHYTLKKDLQCEKFENHPRELGVTLSFILLEILSKNIFLCVLRSTSNFERIDRRNFCTEEDDIGESFI